MVRTRSPKLLQTPAQLQHVFKMDFRPASQTLRMTAVSFRRAEMEILLHRPDRVVSPFPTLFFLPPTQYPSFLPPGTYYACVPVLQGYED